MVRPLALAAVVLLTAGSALQPIPGRAQTPHLRIVLVGDSTVNEEGGWGFAFRLWLQPWAECLNTAVNGRSTKSFIDEGRWEKALALRGDYYLIQFGHNDEPGKGPDRETDPETTYAANLGRFVDDVRRIGGTPILITSMARRQFDASGHVVPTLAPYVDAMKRVALERRVPLIDLDASSRALVERMGDPAWAPLSARTATGDLNRTHLNTRGSLQTAPLVIDELRTKVPAIAAAFAARPYADAIVAADGSADYATIQAAIDTVPQNTRPDRRWTIVVRRGRYREVVYVQREKRFVNLIGEDPSLTTLTFDLRASATGPNGLPIGTFRTPTLQIDADDFTVENLTIENDAGPVGQALAVRADGDRLVFRHVRLLGWQDTLFLNRGRQYFEDSQIAGHVDFIFGGATAFFERCDLRARGDGYITAAATPPEQKYGFVFANGHISGETGVHTFLGRPWRDFAAVAFINTTMSDVVRPEGWHNWDRPERERTTRYGEAGSSGDGAALVRRVTWARRFTAADIRALTVRNVLGGVDGWNPLAVPARQPARSGPLVNP